MGDYSLVMEVDIRLLLLLAPKVSAESWGSTENGEGFLGYRRFNDQEAIRTHPQAS